MQTFLKYLFFVLVAFLLSGQAIALSHLPQKKGDPQKEEQADDAAVKQLEGTVEVSFKIDGQGRVQIVSMNATNDQLAEYVIRKLNKIKLEKGDPQQGKIIKYRFVFKKQA